MLKNVNSIQEGFWDTIWEFIISDGVKDHVQVLRVLMQYPNNPAVIERASRLMNWPAVDHPVIGRAVISALRQVIQSRKKLEPFPLRQVMAAVQEKLKELHPELQVLTNQEMAVAIQGMPFLWSNPKATWGDFLKHLGCPHFKIGDLWEQLDHRTKGYLKFARANRIYGLVRLAAATPQESTGKGSRSSPN